MALTLTRAEGRGQRAEHAASARRGSLLSALFCSYSALCPLPSASAVSVSAEIIDRVLAILPGQIITLSDVEAALDLGLVDAPADGDRLAGGLSAVIDRVLMLNEVRRVAPPEPSPAAIDARVALIRQRFGAAAELSRLLAARGLDETVLRLYAADDLRLASYLDERFSAAAQPDRRGNPASRRIRAPAPDRRSPPCADRRLDCGVAAKGGCDSASSELKVLLQFLVARNTNISAALNPEWLTTGAMMLRRVM